MKFISSTTFLILILTAFDRGASARSSLRKLQQHIECEDWTESFKITNSYKGQNFLDCKLVKSNPEDLCKLEDIVANKCKNTCGTPCEKDEEAAHDPVLASKDGGENNTDFDDRKGKLCMDVKGNFTLNEFAFPINCNKLIGGDDDKCKNDNVVRKCPVACGKCIPDDIPDINACHDKKEAFVITLLSEEAKNYCGMLSGKDDTKCKQFETVAKMCPKTCAMCPLDDHQVIPTSNHTAVPEESSQNITPEAKNITVSPNNSSIIEVGQPCFDMEAEFIIQSLPGKPKLHCGLLQGKDDERCLDKMVALSCPIVCDKCLGNLQPPDSIPIDKNIDHMTEGPPPCFDKKNKFIVKTLPGKPKLHCGLLMGKDDERCLDKRVAMSCPVVCDKCLAVNHPPGSIPIDGNIDHMPGGPPPCFDKKTKFVVKSLPGKPKLHCGLLQGKDDERCLDKRVATSCPVVCDKCPSVQYPPPPGSSPIDGNIDHIPEGPPPCFDKKIKFVVKSLPGKPKLHCGLLKSKDDERCLDKRVAMSCPVVCDKCPSVQYPPPPGSSPIDGNIDHMPGGLSPCFDKKTKFVVQSLPGKPKLHCGLLQDKDDERCLDKRVAMSCPIVCDKCPSVQYPPPPGSDPIDGNIDHMPGGLSPCFDKKTKFVVQSLPGKPKLHCGLLQDKDDERCLDKRVAMSCPVVCDTCPDHLPPPPPPPGSDPIDDNFNNTPGGPPPCFDKRTKFVVQSLPGKPKLHCGLLKGKDDERCLDKRVAMSCPVVCDKCLSVQYPLGLDPSDDINHMPEGPAHCVDKRTKFVVQSLPGKPKLHCGLLQGKDDDRCLDKMVALSCPVVCDKCPAVHHPPGSNPTDGNIDHMPGGPPLCFDKKNKFIVKTLPGKPKLHCGLLMGKDDERCLDKRVATSCPVVCDKCLAVNHPPGSIPIDGNIDHMPGGPSPCFDKKTKFVVKSLPGKPKLHCGLLQGKDDERCLDKRVAMSCPVVCDKCPVIDNPHILPIDEISNTFEGPPDTMACFDKKTKFVVKSLPGRPKLHCGLLMGKDDERCLDKRVSMSCPVVCDACPDVDHVIDFINKDPGNNADSTYPCIDSDEVVIINTDAGESKLHCGLLEDMDDRCQNKNVSKMCPATCGKCLT